MCQTCPDVWPPFAFLALRDFRHQPKSQQGAVIDGRERLSKLSTASVQLPLARADNLVGHVPSVQSMKCPLSQLSYPLSIVDGTASSVCKSVNECFRLAATVPVRKDPTRSIFLHSAHVVAQQIQICQSTYIGRRNVQGRRHSQKRVSSFQVLSSTNRKRTTRTLKQNQARKQVKPKFFETNLQLVFNPQKGFSAGQAICSSRSF